MMGDSYDWRSNLRHIDEKAKDPPEYILNSAKIPGQ